MSNRKIAYYTIGSPDGVVQSFEYPELFTIGRWREAQELVESEIFHSDSDLSIFPVVVYLFECREDVPDRPLHKFEMLVHMVPCYEAYKDTTFKGKYD